MEKYNRRAVFTELNGYDPHSKDDHFIEVCEWFNGNGFDVEVCANPGARFQLTYGQFKALKKLVKELYKE